jgi:phosphoglycolate phosphatase
MTRKLILFDCDGTIVDSQASIVAAMNEAFAVAQLPAPTRNKILRVVGLSLPQAMAVLAPSASPSTQIAITDGYRAAAQRIRQNAAEDALYPGAAETIAHLATRNDHALGIATGKSMRGVRRLLAHYGWADHFHTLQTADNNPSKPHPAMVDSARAETGIDADRAVMIGDTTFDMEMAKAAGVRAIGVGWGYHAASELTAAGAVTVVMRYDDLIGTIDDVLGAT